VKEKEPHLEAGKAVDAKWQPLVKKAKAGADEVKGAIAAWETEKLRRQREIERQQQEELRRQEEARRSAEAANEAQAPQQEAEVLLAPSPVPAAAPTPIQPTYGKAASVSSRSSSRKSPTGSARDIHACTSRSAGAASAACAARADAAAPTFPASTTEEKANHSMSDLLTKARAVAAVKFKCRRATTPAPMTISCPRG
jgi:hypothetical protein